MNKREAKIRAYNIIGNSYLFYSYLFYSELLEEGTHYTDKEKIKIIKQIDLICQEMRSKANNLLP